MEPAEYTYYFVDPNTGTIMAELPLIDPHFESRLNAPGSWSAKVNYTDPQFKSIDFKAVTEPCTTQVWVVRNGALVWAGWVWTRKRTSEAFTVELAGNELMSYWSRRVISYTVNAPLDYNTDQFNIVTDLIYQTNIIPQFYYHSWQPLTYSGPLSGVTVKQTYDPSQLTTLLQAFTDLSSGNNTSGGAGFDFAVDPFFNPSSGALSSRLNLSYPRRGRTAAVSGLVLDASADAVIGWGYEEDGTTTGNSTYVQGSGSGATGLRANTLTIANRRMPWLDRVSSHSYITDQNVLDGIALQEQALYGTSTPLVSSVTIPADMPGMEFGTYITGDSLLFQSSDEWFGTVGPGQSPGLSGVYRLIAWDLKPANEGVDQVTITLNNATAAGVTG